MKALDVGRYPSPERDCVADQPQGIGKFDALRLVEDDTAAVRSRSTPTLFAFAASLALLLTSCSQDSIDETAVTEVRGQPIAKIAPPTTETPSAGPASTNNSVAQTPISSTKQEPPNAEPEFATAGFDILSSYNIEISDELLGPVTNNLAEISAKTEALIPEKVKAYNKKKVALKGFMLPLKVEGGLVTEMLVMKDQSMCCYGTVPKIHEWVSIKMNEKGVKPLMDQPVTLFGKLHVGEMRENGYLTGIYRMDGEKMGTPDEN